MKGIKGFLLLTLIYYVNGECTVDDECKLKGLCLYLVIRLIGNWVTNLLISSRFIFTEKFGADPHNKQVGESQLANQIVALLEHYKQKDPLGIPGAPIPDPFPVPDMKKSVGMGTLTMKKTLAYGFSKFRIKSINFDVNKLLVSLVWFGLAWMHSHFLKLSK